MSQLLPPGIASLRDLPHTIHSAINRACNVLAWQEHLGDEEQPPKRIWDDNEALKEHFDRVRSKRKRELDGGSSDWNREIEDPVDNEAAKDLLRG